jgi:hypothetical protein
MYPLGVKSCKEGGSANLRDCLTNLNSAISEFSIVLWPKMLCTIKQIITGILTYSHVAFEEF